MIGENVGTYECRILFNKKELELNLSQNYWNFDEKMN